MEIMALKGLFGTMAIVTLFIFGVWGITQAKRLIRGGYRKSQYLK